MNEFLKFLMLFFIIYIWDKFLFFITDCYYSWKYCGKNKKGCTNWHCNNIQFCPYAKWNIYDGILKSYRPMTREERKELIKNGR